MKITLLTGKTFDIENAFDFPLKIKTSLRLKHMGLRIDHKSHEVICSVPKFCSKKKIVEFIGKHLDWIEQKLSNLPALKDFEDGERIRIFGRDVVICHQEDFGAPKLVEDKLFVGGDKAFLHRRVKDFIKREAKKEFLHRSQILADKLQVKLSGVTIKDTKSRYGSCSTLKHINYSWRIALAPDMVIDYLMAHEVAHLKHQNHSPAFWQTVRFLDINCDEGKSWLSAHGNELFLYR